MLKKGQAHLQSSSNLYFTSYQVVNAKLFVKYSRLNEFF